MAHKRLLQTFSFRLSYNGIDELVTRTAADAHDLSRSLTIRPQFYTR
jgi:hypothetical protein